MGRKPNRIKSTKIGLAIPGYIYVELERKATGKNIPLPKMIYKILAKSCDLEYY